MISMMPCFSLMEQNASKLHSVDPGSDFDTKNMEIETLLNVFLER
ncbi:hypothetical protein NJ7G_2303 [Natrinema sp. J7-2]|nr:hypothetical protein NJ7G_2303 [Natrinema sp. J7-2]